MKIKLLSLAVSLALGVSASAHAALYDTYGGLTHTETESGFVSGSDLMTPYAFDFTLAADSVMSFSGESSLAYTALGLYDGASLLRGWFLTPFSGSDVTTFALAAGTYSFKTVFPVSGPGYYAFESSIVSSVPEPDSYAIFLAGLGMIGLIARRKLDLES